jgi:hypothetical protein
MGKKISEKQDCHAPDGARNDEVEKDCFVADAPRNDVKTV